MPTLLEVYDSLVGNTEGKVVQMGLNVDGGREGESVASKFAPAKQLNPATVHHPPVTRPLSISSIASLSSSSSSSGKFFVTVNAPGYFITADPRTSHTYTEFEVLQLFQHYREMSLPIG